jgi:hypothetical protein
LVDRLPLVVFLTKMAAVASEKTIRSSLPGMVLWLWSGAGRRVQSPPGTRRLLCWLGRPSGGRRESGGRRWGCHAVGIKLFF